MSETPTTIEVRMSYGDIHCPDPNAPHDDRCPADEAFERWLTEHDQEVWNSAIVKAADVAFKRKSGYETGIDLLELKRESLNSGKDTE